MTEAPVKAGVAAMALLLCCLCYIATMYLRSCPAILALDLQRDFGVDAAGVTLFSSAAFVGYGIMQMPAGLASDAFGGRKTLAALMLLAAVATVVFAYASSLGLGVGARFATGLCLAAIPPVGALLALYFPSGRYAQVMGLLMASGGLGTVLAAEPLARLSVALEWRGAMLVSALVIACLGVMVFVLLRDGKAMPQVEAERASIGEKLRGISRSIRRIFRSPQYWGLAVWQIATAAAFFSFISMWSGPYLMEACGLDKLAASHIMFMQGAGAFFLAPVLSTLADKFNSRRAGLVVCSALPLVGCLALTFFSGSLSAGMLTICIMTLPAGGMAGTTCVFALVRRNFPPELTGTGIGCANMFWPIFAAFLNEIMSVVVDFFMGGPAQGLLQTVVAAAYGKAFMIYVACYAVALLLALFFIKENFSLKEARSGA